MGLTYASFYGLARVNGSGPEVKNWAATDSNVQTTSLLLKAQEMHIHNGATPMRYPGYQSNNPATPISPTLTMYTTGGSLAAGITVGVRTSFINNIGLETEASPEVQIQTPAIVTRPSAMITTGAVSTPVPGAVTGGTYIYAITKRMGTGESETSDVITVTVPYDATGLTSYTVPLSFASINSYTDGTDSLCIYRSTGFDNSFVLLTILTATPGRQNAQATYIDNNTITNSTQQPPQSSQFAKQNSLNINWNAIPIPSSAVTFNVYVTQQAGVYGVNSLLQSYSLVNPATPMPSNYTYQGTEVLAQGYPQEFSQLPYGAAPIYLTTQAYGAPYYTEPANAKGWPTYNFRLPDQYHSTPMMGSAYVDYQAGQFKIVLSTPGGTGVFTTLAAVGNGYAHPTVESGGHPASRIQAAIAPGGPTQDQLNAIFSTPVAGGSGRFRTSATNVYSVAATPMTEQLSTVGAWTPIPDMTTANQWTSGINPDFTGQWFEINFDAGETLLTPGSGLTSQYLQTALFINGVQQIPTTTASGGTFPVQTVSTSSNPYVARASCTTSPTIANGTAQAITLDTEQYDPNGNMTTTGYTAPVSGYYQINGQVRCNSASYQIIAIIKVNGTVRSEGDYGAGYIGNVSDLLYLNSGDLVTLNVQVNGAGTQLTMGAAGIDNFLSIALVNPVPISVTNTVSGNFSVYGNNSFHFATPLTRSNNVFQVMYFLSQPGFATSVGTNIPNGGAPRGLIIKELF